MARYLYGGSAQDFVFTLKQGIMQAPNAGTVVTFWTQPSGGSLITDLQDLVGNTISQVSLTNTSFLPQFWGPDTAGAFAAQSSQMWADAGGGYRLLVTAPTGEPARAKAAEALLEPIASLDADVAAKINTSGSAVQTALGSGFVAAPIASIGAAQLKMQSGSGGFQALKAFLTAGVGAAAALVHGDSTGAVSPTETDTWVYDFAAWIASKFPALTVRYRAWQAGATPTLYLAPVVIQTGVGGYPGAAFLGAGAGNGGCAFVQPTAYAPLYLPGYGNVTGDLDIAVKVAPAVWPVTANGECLASRFGPASGSYGWRFFANTDGTLHLNWSPDGTSTNQVTITSSAAVTGVSAGQAIYLRATLKLTGGVSGGFDVNFYQSADGYNWTAVGTTQSNAAATTIYQPASQNYVIGARSIGTGGAFTSGADFFAGTFYEVWLRQGIGGPTLLPVQVADWILSDGMSGAGTTPVLTGGPLLDIINGSWASHNTYNTLTNLAALTPQFPILLSILNHSHNDGALIGPNYQQYLSAWKAGISARAPLSGFAVTGQNPETSPVTAASQMMHQMRHGQLAAWAAQNGATYLDIYNTFLADPRWDGTVTGPLMNVDGTGKHPSPAGWLLWSSVVQQALQLGA